MGTQEAVIVGAAESDTVGRVPDKSVLQLQAEAAQNAIDDAGISPDSIDGLFIQGAGFRDRFHFPQVTVGEYLGIDPRISSSNDMGGASAYGHVEYAKLAIEAGIIDQALVTYGSTNYSDRKRGTTPNRPEQAIFNRQYQDPYGYVSPIAAYAMAAQRYLHEYDVTETDLAEIAVSTREWAKLNPKAMMQDDLTVEDVRESPPICTPLNKLDCCLVSDAGGALVLASSDSVDTTNETPPIRISGIAQTHTHDVISQMDELIEPGARRTAEEAYKMAGVSPSDIDVAQLYDSFTITTALLTEAVSLAKPGEATELFASGETRPGGSMPINTSGGGLSYLHPGTYGIFTIIEAVRQVRGTAGDRQAPGVETALAHGVGGRLSTQATMILEVAE